MAIIYTIETAKVPSGAAYNRVQMLCRGLKCKLITFKPQNRYVKFLRYILLLMFSGKNDTVIIYGEHLWLKYFVKIPRRCKLIVERNEYSTYLIRENVTYVEKIKEFEKALSRCDGMIVCSQYLKNYYSQFTNAHIIIIPLIVDIDKFNIADYNPQNYIAYCGDFGGNKDGLPILLEAFAKVESNCKLYLIGDTSEDNTMEILRKRVIELGIVEKVFFTGRIPHSDMPNILGNAKMMVLARPANKQAEGGIPSKLAEYLATGRPTLVTRVGELDRYFTDKKDIFFAIPDSVDDFATKMNYILKNYSEASLVGKSGAESIKQFDFNLVAKKILNYVQG